MESRDPESGTDARGPAARLLHLGESLLTVFFEAARTRFELLSVEFTLEKQRLLRVLAIALVFSVAALLGLAFLSFFIIAYFWDSYRLVAVAGVTIVYVAIALAAALSLWRILGDAQIPFPNTRDTLERDLEALRSRMHPAHDHSVTSDLSQRDME